MSCCDPNGCNQIFRGGYVESDRRRFLRRGLDARQRRLLGPVDALAGQRVLDLGCGVGALGLSALRDGAAEAELIDASQAYVAAAQRLADTMGLSDRVRIRQGDASRLDLARADLVTLDRVVCCAPDGPELLRKAAALSRDRLAFSYPPPRGPFRLGRALLNGVMRLLRRDYRFYLHSEDALLAAAASDGHELVARERHGVWRVALLRRPG